MSPPLWIVPWTPYERVPDSDRDFEVVSHAARFRLSAMITRIIKVFIKLMGGFLLYCCTPSKRIHSLSEECDLTLFLK
jgi:hypothetical protein